ncbi:flavin reductase family protein [Sediminibacillus halophilus]|uniref:NADH-FMN oxidoreductase RutF, flavin reductase (DIM6/NTAB) family n=1 Tax=Sediminibacillus halophilus TaxID=482461 RepID=A0A1G9TFS4_9BACI|nr:flavin reductase family protein [Sediminibacillus halophilus]SDM46557.1 NADH-FMN oxidoreductase RutF, flavin reductase (DIM6/NTAB) family [Sediminibacillus halophilus]
MKIEPSQFAERDMSKLIKGAVVPRPIAWVSTINEEGIPNLAPFSFFTVASMEPITLCFSVGGSGRVKDTLENVRATKAFVVNIVNEQLANQMYETSKAYPPDTDEFLQAGLTSVPGEKVSSPRVAAAPVQMECELDRIIDIGSNSLVLGRLVCYHIQDEVYMETDKVDPEALQVIGRMAGDYTHIDDFFELPGQEGTFSNSHETK